MKSKSYQSQLRPVSNLGLSITFSLLMTGLPVMATSTVGFLGVAAGDASSTDVTLWTRAADSAHPGQPVSVTLQVSDSPLFHSLVTNAPFTTTGATADNTLKVNVTNLDPNTQYYYRFVAVDGAASNVGTFKTAPSAKSNQGVRFAFSGDCDGLIRPYALTSQIASKNLDFFMFDGDTEYETSASIGSPAVTSTGNIPAPSSVGATRAQLFNDFSRKYREQFFPVNVGGQNCLQPFFAGQGNYTAYDNHELGNKQYINGGAPAGGPVGDFTTGAGVDARVASNDVNASGPYMNKSGGFLTLQQVYLNYQPVKDRGTLNTPSDPRTNGTPQLFFSQQWGRHAVFINVDDRTYRDIRMKTSSNADDTGARADNANRTMLGTTQLTWLKQTLLDAEQAGTIWKFINISDPIDQIGPIGGGLTLQNAPTTAEYGPIGTITSITTTAATTNSKTLTVADTVGLQAGQPVAGAGVPANTVISAINTDGLTFTVNNNCTVASGASLSLSPAASAYAPVSSDGGKSWVGGYRAERNDLLKFIADHEIRNVVFLATDDHQNRVNEVTYSPSGQTGVQSSYVKVPYCFSIVCGPLGATGPDLITNHSFALAQKLSNSIANAQLVSGVEPLGLAGYPGLHNVTRLGDPNADSTRQPADFYSPDTYNYNVLEVSKDGRTLSVTSYGINSTTQNSFLEYDAANNPEKVLFSFKVDAANPIDNIDHIIVVYQENWSFDSLYGLFPGANGLANSSAASLDQKDRLTGATLSSELGTNNYNNASRTSPAQNTPPQPLNGNVIDINFPSTLNTLLPYNLANYISSNALTGDIVHRYWQEQLQVNDGSNNMFLTWSDNPGLVMSYFDATNLPEGKLAQQYTLCDNYFHSAFGGSFLNHQFLVAAAAPVYPNAATIIPNNVAALDADGKLQLNVGGPSNGRIFRDGNITPIGGQAFAIDGQTFDQNYAVNTIFSANLQSSGSPTATSLLPSLNNSNASDGTRPYSLTIGDRLDAADISWKWYSGGWDRALAQSPTNPTHYGTTNTDASISLFQWHHQPFAYFDKFAPFVSPGTYAANPSAYPGGLNPYSAARLQDENQFFTDVQNGTLPTVCFIKPLGPDNEHPGYASLQQGQNHVASIVQAVQANPDLWAHTAIIVTYDEHGGRWDHVTPPVRDIWGPGVRVPCIVISPFAKKGYIDHVQRDTSSILATIEERFNLEPLNHRDASAPGLGDVFTTDSSPGKSGEDHGNGKAKGKDK